MNILKLFKEISSKIGFWDKKSDLFENLKRSNSDIVKYILSNILKNEQRMNIKKMGSPFLELFVLSFERN
jgi:hypothetical protein